MLLCEHAVLRRPGPELIHGLSMHQLGATVAIDQARKQHQNYVEALQKAGVRHLTILDADTRFPDGCFVEDTHVIYKDTAIALVPGTKSRQEEPQTISDKIPLQKLLRLEGQGVHVDGGDIIITGSYLYGGLSSRTNKAGFTALAAVVAPLGLTAISIKLPFGLHLKSIMTAIDDHVFVALPSAVPLIAPYAKKVIAVPAPEEAAAANMIRLNQTVIMPPHCPQTKALVMAYFAEQGEPISILEVDTSEFAKVDGALTCLSLLF